MTDRMMGTSTKLSKINTLKTEKTDLPARKRVCQNLRTITAVQNISNHVRVKQADPAPCIDSRRKGHTVPLTDKCLISGQQKRSFCGHALRVQAYSAVVIITESNHHAPAQRSMKLGFY